MSVLNPRSKRSRLLSMSPGQRESWIDPRPDLREHVHSGHHLPRIASLRAAHQMCPAGRRDGSEGTCRVRTARGDQIDIR